MSYKSEMERVAADRAAREEAAKKASAVPKEVTPTATKAKEETPVETIFKEVTPTASTAKAAPTSAPAKGDGIKTVTELEVERLRKELEEAKKAASEANKKAAENAKKVAEAEKAANKKDEPEKSDKKGDAKMSEKASKMVAPMGYAAKARALLDCMYATCAQFEQEVAELETLEQILVTSEDELGNAEHVWKYNDRNGIPCFARTMGEVLKNSPGGKPEETWAFIVRGQFLELTREQKEMFGLA